MCIQMQKLSNPTKDDYPCDFSPLPLNASKGPLQVNSSTGEDNISLSEVCIGIRMVFLMEFFFVTTLLIKCGPGWQMPPKLEINSFSISNLNISDSKMMAVWNTSIRFQHFKMDSAAAEVMDVDQVKGYIFYKNMDNMLAAAKGKAFSLRANESKTVQMKFVKTGLEVHQFGVGEEVVIREISRELENGVMHFSLMIDLGVSSKKWGIRLSDMGWYCWDLMAGVDPSTGKGRLISAQCVDCYRLMTDRIKIFYSNFVTSPF